MLLHPVWWGVGIRGGKKIPPGGRPTPCETLTKISNRPPKVRADGWKFKNYDEQSGSGGSSAAGMSR
jgi:hypothetical protein